MFPRGGTFAFSERSLVVYWYGASTAERGTMTISSSIAPHLPYLRRFARAVSGSQSSGDAYALATLEAIVADTHALRKDLEPRVALYQVFLRVWGSVAFSTDDHGVENRLSSA